MKLYIDIFNIYEIIYRYIKYVIKLNYLYRYNQYVIK